MLSSAEVRELALALPEAFEADHHGRPSFRVGAKIFATLWDERHVNVMMALDGILTAVAAHPACSELHWGKRLAAAQVDLDLIERDQLAELLTDAWEYKRG